MAIQLLTCKAWPIVSYDTTEDTQQTVQEARRNNAARSAFGCDGITPEN